MKVVEVRKVLLDNKFIADIEIEENKVHKGKNYKILIHCQLEVYRKFIPIVIGIPHYWEIKLFDFYWDGKFPYIPHIDSKGKFCLYDLEGTLIDTNFRGLLNQCIDRVRDLVKKGENGDNKNDFLLEFDSYFALLPNTKHVKVSIPKIKKNINIKFCQETVLKKRNQHYNVSYFSSAEPNDFKIWGLVNRTQLNGMYLYIKPNQPIYPPNFLEFNQNEIKFLNKLFNYIDLNTFNKLKSKCKKNLFIIFEIEQSKKNTNCCGFIIENPYFTINDKIKIEKFDQLVPLLVSRVDTMYLTNRTSFTINNLENKSYLLIGCGSIGGYIFHNLLKSGCKNITLIDDDILKEENIYRHLLGIEYVGLYKSVALENYAKKSISEINIKSVSEKIQVAIKDCGIKLDNYDYIISATGNHNINLWINKFIKENNINCTVFYVWNEALDIGCHVALIDSNRNFDYKDLFGRDENGELYDLTSFAAKGQNFAKSHSGCFGTFIPYGSDISLRSSLLFMDVLKQNVEGRIQKNVIYSEKCDDFYFRNAGFKISDRYQNQQNKLEITQLGEFRKDKHACR